MFKFNKLFGTMVEASAAKKNPRFNDYHTGRLAYEKYLSNHPDLFNDNQDPTPAARREAKKRKSPNNFATALFYRRLSPVCLRDIRPLSHHKSKPRVHPA